MLKISLVKTNKSATTVRLEGRVVGPWVGELREICQPLANAGGKLTVDLAEVTFADESGVTLLDWLRSRGAQLRNAMPFVEEQLKSARSSRDDED